MSQTEGVFQGLTAQTVSGEDVALEQYQKNVVLVVNVASKCGFTPQYKGLQHLYEQFHERGFFIIGFPCNQFGGQEPGSDAEIQSFCRLSYGVTFPIFAKVDVNGSEAHPLFVRLKEAAKGVLGTEAIKWNFTKFLVGRDAKVVKRFAPSATPESLTEEIEALL